MRRLWLVDGFNVLHAGWDRPGSREEWWRRAHRERLLERVRRFSGLREPDATLWVVFDGEGPREEEPAPPVPVAWAPSADDWIVRRVKRAAPDEEVSVVTGDRKLADRCRHHGATIISPLHFLRQCV